MAAPGALDAPRREPARRQAGGHAPPMVPPPVRLPCATNPGTPRASAAAGWPIAAELALRRPIPGWCTRPAASDETSGGAGSRRTTPGCGRPSSGGTAARRRRPPAGRAATSAARRWARAAC
eukprot:scaffold1320_cov326-Prasinococcus_capsulatus_cf.AAC.5